MGWLRRLFWGSRREKADVKCSPEVLAPEPVLISWETLADKSPKRVLEVPEPVVDLEYAGLTDAAIALRVEFDYDSDMVPICITATKIVFNVNPEFVSESGIVNVDFRYDYGCFDMDLADLLAAGIGWEMTTWTVLMLEGFDTSYMFDDFIMWKNNKIHWLMPIPESK